LEVVGQGEAPERPNSMAMAGLGCRKAIGGTGRAISVLSGINGLRNKLSHLYLNLHNTSAVFQLPQAGIFD